MNKNPNKYPNQTNYDDNQANNDYMDLINTAVKSNIITQSDGLWSQLNSTQAVPWEPSISISKIEFTYLEKIEIAADLLAGQVITSSDFFKLKSLLKSKDPDVRKLGEIFLNEKIKL